MLHPTHFYPQRGNKASRIVKKAFVSTGKDYQYIQLNPIPDIDHMGDSKLAAIVEILYEGE